ncbi:MAG: helix-turn-helix domain-containing protein [Alphaproteobacteria bacterium]|nr:helix-turn-helix domain-containing protein [Alphaproteobacteria bacterium]
MTREAELWDELAQLLVTAAEEEERAPASEPGSKTPENDKLLRVHHAAELLGLSASTLSKWRVTGGGPEFIKVGRRVLYQREAIDRFIADKVMPHTSRYFQHPTGKKK